MALRKTLPGAILLGLSFLLSGCLGEDPKTTAELKELREEVATLKEEKERAGDVDALKAENQALKAGLENLEMIRKRLEASDRDAEELRQRIESLKKENQELERKSISRARTKGIGESIALLECPGGKSYENAVIRSIDDTGVTIRHDGGVATLRANAVPRAWVSRFTLVTEEEKQRAASARELVARESTGKATATTTSGASAPAAVVAAASPAPASEGGMDALANRVLPAVVLIKGDQSEGTGFFMKDDGDVYLYTAGHVLSGNKTIEARTSNGTVFRRFGIFQTAVNADIVRLAVLDDVPLAVPQFGNGDIPVGSPIVAIGNSGGGGVLNVLEGKVKAIGSGQIEVDAGVIQGNSGGPVFNADGKVLGVVTHLMAARKDVWASATQFSDIRRFAARLDGNIEWKEMPVGTFVAEARTIESFDRTTRLLFAVASLRMTRDGFDGTFANGYTALSILQENSGSQAVKSLLQMSVDLQTGARKSERDVVKRYLSYYGEILSAARGQSDNFVPDNFSYCNRREAKLSVEWRGLAETRLTERINALSSIR